jgi:hypothetical protein
MISHQFDIIDTCRRDDVMIEHLIQYSLHNHHCRYVVFHQ